MSEQLIYNEPVAVICINAKTSIKLIKDAIYYAMSMKTYTHGKTVTIKDIGFFNSSLFTLLDGTPLNSEPDFKLKEHTPLNIYSNNYTGQFVKCRKGNIKSLKLNEVYYVEDQLIKTYVSKYNNKTYPETKFKIRGIDRPLSPFNFEEMSIAEQRNIKLKNLNGSEIFKTGEQSRKFLQYDEKEKVSVLIDTLNKVLIDAKRVVSVKNKLNLTSLMIKKGMRHSLIAEDINNFLTPEIKKLLLPYDFEF